MSSEILPIARVHSDVAKHFSLTHPAFRVHHPEGSVVPESFEPFLDFIGPLEPPVEKDQFTKFLRELFAKTNKGWRPAKCLDTFEIAPVAREIAPRHFSKGAQLIVMLNTEGHVWLLLAIDKTFLVIDPAGVLDKSLGCITPYFGSENDCRLGDTHLRAAKDVYIGSLPLNPETERLYKSIIPAIG